MVRNNQIGGVEDGVTPRAAAEQGIITYEEAEKLSAEKPESIQFETTVGLDIQPPSDATIEHWSEETIEVTVGNETRLYAIGERGEKFAYVVRESDNIAIDLMRLHEKVIEIRFGTPAAEQERTDGAVDLAA